MYTNIKYPQILLVTCYPGSGCTSTLADGGSLSVNRSDTYRRRKPNDLFGNQTPVSTQVVDIKHGAISASRPDGYTFSASTASFGVLGRPNNGGLESKARVICENKLRAQAKNVGLNLANMLGEYRQTASMFGSLSRSAINLYRNTISRRALKGLSTKAISNKYLEWQYGIRPLCSDMGQAIKELQGAKLPSLFVEAHHREVVFNSGNLPYSFGKVVHWDSYCQYDVRCKARVKYNDMFFQSFSAQHGLSNLPALAWELTPFSFVADWWLNIGEVISSLDNCLVFSGLSGYTSCRDREQVTLETGHFKYLNLSRVYGNFSLVSSFVPNTSSSLTHITNGLALWRQTIRNP